MSDNSFQVYLNSVLTLAQTLIIKSEYVAQRVNDRLLQFQEYETDADNPETWKYYMNLAGEYHPTDTVMQVVSSDNLATIDFTPANLVIHKNTARDYQFGTRQYGELLAKYPTQEDVILGILYPVDKATAIAAPDHTILGYPVNAIESNEYTLVNSLQDWTTIYFKRYYNEQYTISDSLYYGVVLSMYYMNLIPLILTERLKRHKTIEAHSFYVSNYLASNSSLGEFYPFMNLDQAMHFYRNILYYQRHPGNNDTLSRLVDALMTKRNIPLADYTMRHDTTNVTENVYADVTFKRTDLTSVPSSGAPEYIDVPTFLAKENDFAPDNLDEITYSQDDITQFLKDSPSNVVQTKVLESAMVDYSGAQTYKLSDIQVAHWLYYASNGLYSAVVNVSNPKTSERIVLTVKDAYILATYCMYKQYGFDMAVIPLLGAQRVQRYPIPSDADLQTGVDLNYVDDFALSTAKQFVVEATPMISIDAFYAFTDNIFKSANFQRNLVAYQEGMQNRSEVFKYVERFYGDAYVRLQPEGTTYSQWLLGLNLNFDTLSADEFGLLYTSLVGAALGQTLVTAPSLRNIQKAMANALMDLSSYTIQVVTQMADDETIMTDLPSVRVGDQKISASGHEYLRVGSVEVLSHEGSATNNESVPINIFKDILSHKVTGRGKFYVNLRNGPHEPDRGQIYQHKFNLSRMEFSLVNPPDVSGTPLQQILGMDQYMALTDEQKTSLFES
uniref:Virion structural protein n=1 Tax=Burkholderia phage vB_BgluM-SURPRISE13 TaxID=3159457 RepID=A0AAU7PF18_9VIRU